MQLNMIHQLRGGRESNSRMTAVVMGRSYPKAPAGKCGTHAFSLLQGRNTAQGERQGRGERVAVDPGCTKANSPRGGLFPNLFGKTPLVRV